MVFQEEGQRCSQPACRQPKWWEASGTAPHLGQAVPAASACGLVLLAQGNPSDTGSGISLHWLVARTDRSALNWERSCQRLIILVNQHKTTAKSDNVVTHCMLLLLSVSFAALGVHSIKRLYKLIDCKSLWLLFSSYNFSGLVLKQRNLRGHLKQHSLGSNP